MHRQLQDVVEEFKAAEERLHGLMRRVPEARWRLRSDPARWSMAECVEHLNLTSKAYLPLIQAALERGRATNGARHAAAQVAGVDPECRAEQDECGHRPHGAIGRHPAARKLRRQRHAADEPRAHAGSAQPLVGLHPSSF